jgi:hypothetical protein
MSTPVTGDRNGYRAQPEQNRVGWFGVLALFPARERVEQADRTRRRTMRTSDH